MTTQTTVDPLIQSLTCIRCGVAYPVDFAIDSRGCPACYASAPANLAVAYTKPALDRRAEYEPGAGATRFLPFLPVRAESFVTLGEGETALVRIDKLGAELGVNHLYAKDESRNPTWSHKDRFSCVAVSHAKQIGASVIATASSGNAGASLAAYAAKASLPCVVATFAGAAGPMVEQIRRYGATVLTLRDKNDRWPLLAEATRRFGWFVTSPFAAPVVGSHPVGIEGYKVIAYETYEQLGRRAPDWFIAPVAYGDVIAGVGRGFQDLLDLGLIERLPRLVAAEVHGSLRRTLETRQDGIARVAPNFETRAISIGVIQSTYQALNALRTTNGTAVAISDDQLLEMQARLAQQEGLFCELSSAIGMAAAAELRRSGGMRADDRVVCLMTASGLKDLDQTASREPSARPLPTAAAEALRLLAEHHDFIA